MMYQHYLHLVRLPEENMMPEQRIMMRDSFFAGIGHFLVFVQEELPKMEGKAPHAALDAIFAYISEYWKNRADATQRGTSKGV